MPTPLAMDTPALLPLPAAEAKPSSLAKVLGAAARGATAAFVAGALSACTEPLVNRLFVKRMSFAAAYGEMSFPLVSKLFFTTFPTIILKFPVFEVIDAVLSSYTSLSGSVRGIVSGWLFCTLVLPVTNYRFRKSMGWIAKPALLYQAYIPTLTRDIIYGWARNTLGAFLHSIAAPCSFVASSCVFGCTVMLACIISSPCNEWRGYSLQPEEGKTTFMKYFKPIKYLSSTGASACIMGISLMVGMLATPIFEDLFTFFESHLTYALFAVGGILAFLYMSIR